MQTIQDLEALARIVRQAVAETQVTDIHTHTFPPAHGKLLLWGIDELLTYHYLVAELFTVAPRGLTYERFWAMGKSEQAALIWRHLFVESSPISEARRGVLTTLQGLGLDPAERDLAKFRQFFAGWKVEDYVPHVLELAGLDYVVMTNDPFVREEAGYWRQGLPVPPYMKPALRIDKSFDFAAMRSRLAEDGVEVGSRLADPKTLAALRGWLGDWIDRMRPVYMAASLTDEWRYPATDGSAEVIDQVLCPLAAERGIPLALMIGVRRQVNPDLHEGGDAVGSSDVGSVIRLCQNHPDTKFLVTLLARIDQHALTVAARKFRNLHLFGCWWFNNNPSIIEEMTRQRLELLGTNVTLQHSDARVLDQVIYKWRHTRQVVAKVLVDKYADAHSAGWRFTQDEVRRDVRRVLGGAFEEFLAK